MGGSSVKLRRSRSRLYRVWEAMIRRCENENDRAYHNYGGRGIKVCAEWRVSSVAFMFWAHANGYRDDLTIDRENTDDDYCPENCRWATSSQQAQSRRKTKRNKSGYVGVCWFRGAWLAYVYHHRKRKTLGYFEDSFSAAWVRDNYVRQHYDSCVTLNKLIDRRVGQATCFVERRGTFAGL